MEEENSEAKAQNFLLRIKDKISKNFTQILIVFVILLPTIVMTFSALAIIDIYQNICVDQINQFTSNLFQDQIQSSMQQNQAVVNQLNSQVQKIPWQINLLNEFFGKNIHDAVIKNSKYTPAIHNIDRSFYRQENKTVLDMFMRNSILTSVWHHVNESHLEDLDEKQLRQIDRGQRLDSIWKAIRFDNLKQKNMWLQIKDIFTGHEYDGLIYMTSINTTYTSYPIPPGCPYVGTYRLDLRCRFYYQPTMHTISTLLFDPKLFYTNANPYLASVFCQRRMRYPNNDPNFLEEKYSILCITLDLTQAHQYFQNFGQNSKFQVFLDPQKLTIIYNSLIQLKSDQILRVQQTETDYLQDQNQAKIFLENISKMSQFVLGRQNSIKDFNVKLEQLQSTFTYNRNGTECFVIQNLITMVDKIPSQEFLKKGKPYKKFELKGAFIFLDVLTKEKMTQYSNDLQNKIKYYNKIFSSLCWGLLILSIFIQFYYSIILGQLLIHPIVHLTNILKQIKIKKQQIQNNNLIPPNAKNDKKGSKDTFQSDASILEMENQIDIEFNIDSDFDKICLSNDTQELLNSFQNLFKILKFTNQNILKQNDSTSLLNLNIQVQFFEKFCNYRALGVCYNNIGVIHYKSSRFQEAVENFQKAIIFAKYELKVYSQENIENIDRLTTIFNLANFENNNKQQNCNSIQNNKNQEQNCLKSDQKQDKEVKHYIPQYCIQNDEELYWNLFQRKLNLLKSLASYLNINSGLEDIFQEFAKENAIISKTLLPFSYKRDMYNYYPILISSFKSKDMKNVEEILKKISILYIKNHEKFQDTNEGNTEKQQTYQNLAYKVLALQNSLFFQNIEESQYLTRKLTAYSKHINEAKTSQILMFPFKKSIIKKENSQQRNFQQEQINYGHDQSHFSNLPQLVGKISSTTIQQIQEESQNESTNLKKRKESQFKSKYFRSSQNEIVLQKSSLLKKSNQKTIKSNLLSQVQLHHIQNEKTKFFSFYKLRKCKSQKKVCGYEFSSDIFFTYYALGQAQLQIEKQNFNQAATILTNSLECCRYYLPHLKIQVLNSLSNIFLKNGLFSDELQEMKDNYSKLENCNFNVLIVSACYKKKSNEKVCKISSDILKEILFKGDDSFGLISYCFNDNLFEQLMAQISIKVVKSYPNLLQLLLQTFFQKHIKKKIDNNVSLFNLEQGQDSDSKNQSQIISLRNNFSKLNKSGFVQKQIFKSMDDYSKTDEEKNLFQIQLKENFNNSKNGSVNIQNLESPNSFENIFQSSKKIQNQILQQSVTSLISHYQFNLKQTQSLQKKQKKNLFQVKHLENSSKKKEISNKNTSIPFQKENSFYQNVDFSNNSQNSFNLLTNKIPQQELNNDESSVFLQSKASAEYFQQQYSEYSPSRYANNQSKSQRKNSLKSQKSFKLDNYQSHAQIFKINQLNGDENLDLSESDSRAKQPSLYTNINLINESFPNKQSGQQDTLLELKNYPDQPHIQNNNYQNHLNNQNSDYYSNFHLYENSKTQNKENQQQNSAQDQNDRQNQTQENIQPSNSNKKENLDSEQLFHFGIHAALKQFILNTEQKINIYLTLKKQMEKQKSKQFQLQKQNQMILIYITDLQLQFKNTNLINKLCQLLINLDVQLLVLVINQQQQTQEYDELQDIVISGKYIIKFFNNEEKLLQYIYNQREHVKNSLLPMIIEYF